MEALAWNKNRLRSMEGIPPLHLKAFLLGAGPNMEEAESPTA
jgi:hypothetical protein